MRKYVMMMAMVTLVALPAAAQLAATDTCTGQPSITGTTTGISGSIDIDGIRAVFNDSFTNTGAGCAMEPAGSKDAVVCFTPQNDCAPGMVLLPGNGNQTLSLNLIEGCSLTTSSCLAGVDEVLTLVVPLTGGVEYCWVGSISTPLDNTEDFVLTQTTDCGALPVEIQKFVVEPGTSSSTPNE